MKILNFHGYGGSPQNAAYLALREIGYSDILSPATDYDAEPADVIYARFRQSAADHRAELLVGTSFGGFFAAALAAEMKLPVILINPCLMPFLHLPRLGYQREITPFLPLFGSLANLDLSRVSCIIGGADEVIDTHDFTRKLLDNDRFRIIPEGKHSGHTLPLAEFFKDVIG